MNKQVIKGLLVIAGGGLFSLVFWQEKLGINALLFDVFLLAVIFRFYPQARKSREVKWLLAGHLTALAALIIHNTPVSQFAFVVTLLLLTGFAEYRHRSAWFAGGSMLLNTLCCAASFMDQFKGVRIGRFQYNQLSRMIYFLFLPLLLVMFFSFIYLASNTVLQDLAVRIEQLIAPLLQKLLEMFDPLRLLFFIAGVYVTGSILLRSQLDYFSRKDEQCEDELKRKRNSSRLLKTFLGGLASNTIALKNEHTIGIISLTLLNLLLFVVNCIDISSLWFGFDYMGNVRLTDILHDGTGLLIISIIMAMLVLLFFFKGNLNFYRRNKWLKYGAYAWIVQNSILVISVLLRDYYYIARYGLAYKRIGVLFFLLMVAIGLATVFIKIWKRKTAYYLLRVNAWAGVIVLVLASSIHWDELIARYNISRQDRVPLDRAFLLTLSDKTLPLLDRNITSFTTPQEKEQLAARAGQFMEKQHQLTWLSWNYADAYTEQYFTGKVQ